ncbi:MFS transporter [Caldalkalibacillus mannanilyticus]|uniref:MFS transporter n=1 Tax=Caldalkalibacillus mannanilyticus TaxID=1418 RepID=UPI000AAFC4FE|nr:MFS transporter [Caldalkalibacillus mannanilyticus]
MSELTIGKEKEIVEVEEVTLFKQKHFLFLWIAGLFSSLSVSFFMFSQSWYVVEVLKLEASLGLIFIAASVPRLLFMALGGVIADRMSRSLIMFISDMTRALLIVGLVVLLVLDMISLWTFVGFALVFGVLDAFFWPASGAFCLLLFLRNS